MFTSSPSMPRSKTAPESAYESRVPIEQGADGVWHVRGYTAAKAVLLGDTTQAGFNAELVQKMPSQMTPPVLFQDGPEHREQRIQTAKFFTPTITHQQHSALMEEYADEIIGEFERAGRADLNALAARMAMAVAADVVGLTESPRDKMAHRLNAILHADLNFGLTPRKLLSYARVQWNLLNFYLFDVRPSIKARRRKPQSDVISHMLSRNRRDPEILAECITYGAAGMVTTQEFICAGAWHLLLQPELRAQMLNGDQEARYRLLHELLRLEPVVAHLLRRASSDLDIPRDGATITIPAGALIDLHINAINADARTVGAEPLRLRPDRALEKGVSRSVMGFGAGPHRCVGEFIALAETDMFLRRLLKVQGLRIEREPTVSRNANIKGYELRNFIIAVGSDGASGGLVPGPKEIP